MNGAGVGPNSRNILIASLVLALALVAGGCGGGRGHAASTTPGLRRASTATALQCSQLPWSHPFVMPPADSLVEMKEEPPGMVWQSIFVRPNGTGLVTTLVGEVVGAHQDPFRLTAAQMATLKRLIAATRSSDHKSPVVRHSGFLYLLHLLGHPSLSFEGNTPTRYGALARFLDQVMYIHC